MKDTKLPIGYYVRQVDKLLTERINAVQSEFGLTRNSWQILNFINEQGTAKKEELINLMMQMADEKTIVEAVLSFNHDGIVSIESGNLLSLTKKGKTLFADCSQKQQEFRQQSMQHVSEQDYKITLSTLEQIIKNIG